ncbi:hypothetical protein HYPSUDRAFT_88584 [Hypholoma sublateritium FD-334 SS-4]|uniref:Uncharacterized protein n=1 Tax=Hypholoma sublateritium (strain FD-334 SS-4) TaxID=945553 RepID=A0A0D2L1Q7_HYPSF|nr:hypothetical protein HYPSUDRAFT_88584 [Hypholoma sublateritium FD-334 SS-4]
MRSRKVYEGPRRQLVLAFDVGTTFSGISYSILQPGLPPEIRTVTRFPAQDSANGTSKIPTIVYYDAFGNVRAVGAEATRSGIDIEAAKQGWVKAEWFKLHLRSTSVGSSAAGTAIPPLPAGKRAVDVLADFLSYLRACAAAYISEAHLGGAELWTAAGADARYVLAHPNGWGGAEQARMRDAAVRAGLVRANERERITFVTEGEASLHFCVTAGVLTKAEMKKCPNFIIVDAGGGTIDISAYRQNPANDTQAFEEIAPAQCLFRGSVFVNMYARRYFVGLLEGTDFEDDVDNLVEVFDKTTKIRFKTDQDPQYLKFGSMRDNDTACNITAGQLRLDGKDVAAFFQPSIDAILQAVLKQQRATSHKISHILFVGGFSANDWLFNNITRILMERGYWMRVVRPEAHINKAVAEGAVSFFLDHFVQTRMSKAFYGLSICDYYDPRNSEHRLRARSTFVQADGRTYVPNVFSVILPKSIQVSEAKIFRQGYIHQSFLKSKLEKLRMEITCYKGLDCDPRWLDIDEGSYDNLCYIEAELPSHIIETRRNPQGKTFYCVDFEVVLFFGLTEIKAQIAWNKSSGREKRGPATVVYDD